MKKTLLIVFCALFSLFGVAQSETTYHNQVLVTANDEPRDPDENDVVIVDNTDGTINIVLKDFVIKTDMADINVGDVVLSNITTEDGADGMKHVNNFSSKFSIPEGNLPFVVKMMIGASAFQNMPYTLNAKYDDVKFFGTIDITKSIAGQKIFIEAKPLKVYTEQLLVTVNEESFDPQMTDVTVVTNSDATINFELKNFVLGSGEETMPIGNIVLDSLSVTKGTDGMEYFSYDASIEIQPGDMDGVDEDEWVGPSLESIPVKLQGKMNAEKLVVTINIEIAGQVVFVQLGTDDQPQRESRVYTEPLVVIVDGESNDPQPTDVTVYNNGDQTVDFELKNFVLGAGEDAVAVGNILVEKLPVTIGSDGLAYISYDDPVNITEGDQEGVSFWLGPQLCETFGAIPVKLNAKMNENKLFATIDIELPLGEATQVIHVQLGTDDFNQPQRESRVYTEPLVVIVDGESNDPQPTDVTVYNNGDQTVDFELKNFVLGAGEDAVAVGNILVEKLPVTMGSDGLAYISYDGPVNITEGDQEGVNFWLGPQLCEAFGAIPVKLNAKMNENKLFATIDIELPLGEATQVIHVQLGTDDFSVEPEGKVYTDMYVVTMNGESTEPQQTSITVYDNGDGTINFVLKDFALTMGDTVMPVGDISLNNVAVTEGEDGLKTFSHEGTFSIPADKLEGTSFAMLAQMGYLNNIPYTLAGKMNDEKMHATININVTAIGEIIVQFGTEFREKGDINGLDCKRSR